MASSNGNRHVIASADDLTAGQRKIVKIGGREIGVFNIDGQYYGVRNICPHKAAPLCRGRLRPLVVSPEVTQVAHERENEILKCPWHMWEFDIKTGCAMHDESVRVRTYKVVLEGDEIVLYA